MSDWSTLVPSIFAIFVATIVYRWQKGIDRRTTISIEMRKEYANFWNLSQIALKMANEGSLTYGDETTGKLIANLSYIDIYGEKDVHKICKELFDHIMYFSSLRKSHETFPHYADLAREQQIEFLKKWMSLNDKLKAALKESHKNHLSIFPSNSSLKWLLRK